MSDDKWRKVEEVKASQIELGDHIWHPRTGWREVDSLTTPETGIHMGTHEGDKYVYLYSLPDEPVLRRAPNA